MIIYGLDEIQVPSIDFSSYDFLELRLYHVVFSVIYCTISYHLEIKGNIFFSVDKTVPVKTAFDLKGTILCLCSNARWGVIKSDLVLGERKQRPG